MWTYLLYSNPKIKLWSIVLNVNIIFTNIQPSSEWLAINRFPLQTRYKPIDGPWLSWNFKTSQTTYSPYSSLPPRTSRSTTKANKATNRKQSSRPVVRNVTRTNQQREVIVLLCWLRPGLEATILTKPKTKTDKQPKWIIIYRTHPRCPNTFW